MVRPQRSAAPKPTIEQFIEGLFSSTDALVIRDGISRIGHSLLSQEEKDTTFIRMVRTYGEMTIVVSRCLSALARSQSPLLRPLCRNLLNAPFEEAKEDVVAYAATLLAEIPNPERVDMLLLAKAVDHRSPSINNAARRAIENLPRQAREALLALTLEIPEKPPIALLKRHISGNDWRIALVVPRRPSVPEGTLEDETSRSAAQSKKTKPHPERRRSEPNAPLSKRSDDNHT